MVAFSELSLPLTGSAPIWPAETWVFCAWTAVMTSAGVSWYEASLSASSQMRMAYCEPKIRVSPTPSMREIGSDMCEAIQSPMSAFDRLSSSVYSATCIRGVPDALTTRTPWLCTSCGRRLIAVWVWFCTWTWAKLGSVPASKTRTTWADPLDEVEVMYFRWSSPVMFCSMTWVTESSTVLAEAPG